MSIQIYSKEFSEYFISNEKKSEVRNSLLKQVNNFLLWEDKVIDIVKIIEEWDEEVRELTIVIYYKKGF